MSIAPQCITITVIKTEKMTKYRTQTTYKIKDSEKTTITDPSQTVQGEAYTIQELLQKHVNGIMPSVGLDPQYDHDDGAELDDDVTMRKPDLDLTDIDSMSEKVRETTNKIKKAKETKRKKARSEQPNDRSSAGAPEAKKGAKRTDY